jgi:pyruvate/oxaloacetate carboxyltransferase
MRIFFIEAWGGATFDTGIRFLDDDPVDRPQRKISIPRTPSYIRLQNPEAIPYTG